MKPVSCSLVWRAAEKSMFDQFDATIEMLQSMLEKAFHSGLNRLIRHCVMEHLEFEPSQRL